MDKQTKFHVSMRFQAYVGVEDSVDSADAERLSADLHAAFEVHQETILAILMKEARPPQQPLVVLQ